MCICVYVYICTMYNVHKYTRFSSNGIDVDSTGFNARYHYHLITRGIHRKQSGFRRRVWSENNVNVYMTSHILNGYICIMRRCLK